MGGSTSKPETPSLEAPMAPAVDLSKLATVSYEAAQQAQQQAVSAAETLRQKAEEALGVATMQTEQAQYMTGVFKWVAGIVGFIAVAFGAMLLYDYLAIKFGWPTIPWFTQEIAQPIIGFKVLGAKYGDQDVTGAVQAKVVDNLYLPSFPINAASLGLAAEPNPNGASQFTVTYSINNGKSVTTPPITINAKASAIVNSPILPPSTGVTPTSSGKQDSKTSTSTSSPNVGSSMLSRMWNYVTKSGSSGNLLSTLYDATTTSTISASSVPLSDETQGSYALQWWMFVKDWNYGFGQKKAVLVRNDPTNSATVNPSVTLHPTENTLQVSVSLYSDGSAGAGTPVAAGSSSTDDVYVCEVADIPLQAWFAVGVSVYGRNLDVYINGNLVKTCFLPGVPKPAAGNIQLTPGGGFSGYMCGLTSLSRMMTPADASSFYGAGTSCQNQVPSGSAPSSGYAVKFGIYNPQGKEVQQYTF